MAAPFGGLPVATASQVALLGSLVLAAYVLYRTHGRIGVGATLRRRFVLGVPWGTVTVVVAVACVYLFVQGAWGSLTDPLVVPFRSWSYFYPLGMLTAAFSHADLSHVTGNLLSTVAFAPVAEYAWSHYPTERGQASFSSLRTNPFARVGAFVAGVVLVGLSTSLFVPGPLIGFSGVVFAFAGFALVRVPVAAVFALVAERALNLAYYAVLDPVATAEASTRFVEPWWAGIAVQGHAFGLLVGALLGVAVGLRRDGRPRASLVWFATLVFVVGNSLYAIYAPLGPNRYVLFRGAGTAAVVVLATLVAVAAAGSDRPLPRLEFSPRSVAAALALSLVLAFALVAVPYSLADVQGADPSDGVTVRDYTVVYAEDVPDGYVGAVEIPFVGDPAVGSARASGVIVTSERRNAWEQVVPAGELAFNGRATVSVGGLGWRERVLANRTAWDAVDAGTTYKVFLRRPGEQRQLAFAAEPVTLAPTVAGLNLSIEPAPGGYRLNATRNGSVFARTPVPSPNASVRLGNATVSRRGADLFVSHEGTRVRVAEYQRRLRS